LVTSKDLVIRNITFPHWNMIYTSVSLLMGRITSRLITHW
jgi:hypothetical protein